MIPGVQPKLLLTQDEDGNLQIDDEQVKVLLGDTQMNWKLVRERDGLTKESNDVLWIEWDDSGRFKEKWDNPSIGRSLLMSPFNDFFTWITTTITEIIEQRDDYIKFKTENSNYELFRIKI